NNFVKRNEEFIKRKENRQRERLEKLSTEMNYNYFTPTKNIQNMRTFEEFTRDQQNFLEMKENNIIRKQEEEFLTTMSKLKTAPEISKKSKKLVKKNDDKDIHTRLFEERTRKQKNNILSGEIHKEKKVRTNEEILQTVETLFNDAKERHE